MIRLTIPADDMQKIKQERFQPSPPRIQRKMEAVYLTGMGLPRHDVARKSCT